MTSTPPSLYESWVDLASSLSPFKSKTCIDEKTEKICRGELPSVGRSKSETGTSNVSDQMKDIQLESSIERMNEGGEKTNFENEPLPYSNPVTPPIMPFGSESDYLRMLKEAQLEGGFSRIRSPSGASVKSTTSNNSSNNIYPPYLVQAYYNAGTGNIYWGSSKGGIGGGNGVFSNGLASPIISPKSPPNSPNTDQTSTQQSLSVNGGHFIHSISDPHGTFDDEQNEMEEKIFINKEDHLLNTFSVPPCIHNPKGANSRSGYFSPPCISSSNTISGSEMMWDWSSRPSLFYKENLTSSMYCEKIDEENDVGGADLPTSVGHISNKSSNKCVLSKSKSQPYTPCQTPPFMRGGGLRYRKGSNEAGSGSGNRSRHSSKASSTVDGGWVYSAQSYNLGHHTDVVISTTPRSHIIPSNLSEIATSQNNGNPEKTHDDEMNVDKNTMKSTSNYVRKSEWNFVKYTTIFLSNLISLIIGVGIGFLIFKKISTSNLSKSGMSNPIPSHAVRFLRPLLSFF